MNKLYLNLIFGVFLLSNTCYANTMNSINNENIENPSEINGDEWRHTSMIGTPENPTIDGGIINTTDGLPVYQASISTHTNLNNFIPSIYNNLILKHTNDLTKKCDPHNSSISFNDNWATSNKIDAILEKAVETGKLQFVLKKSHEMNLPASVATVPIVESEYQDNAISSKGAVGSWQLMSSTAIDNGLDPTKRTQFIPSTCVALNLLSRLHERFGNWELAFAAYNAGSNKVSKALAENPNATSINELNLPIETKNYIKTIRQINNILINSQNDLINS